MKKITPDHPSIRFCSVLFLLLILISLWVFAYSAQAGTTTTSVIPSSVTAGVGQNFSINVTVSSVFDLYGWEFRLSWNATLLDAVDVVEGPFLKSGGSTFFTYKVNVTAGYIVTDCTLLGIIPGVSGNGILATVKFYVKNAGECPLDLHDVTLLNSFEQPIPCQTVDGYGYFTAPHDVAVTNVSASPSAVLPSDIVNINATVQNQGGSTEVFNVTVYVNSEIIEARSISLDSGSSATVPFTWNTTGFEKGDYTISASASIVLGEVDVADNTKMADNIVTILSPNHDVAVIYVETFKNIVGQGYSMHIDVTVKNYGVFNETFDTTVYANTTAIQTETATLTSGNGIKLTFTWNTTGFPKGNYNISTYAEPVLGETDTTDNKYIDGLVLVTVPGDVNGDRFCDMKDIVAMILTFGSRVGDARYKPNYDVNCDGYIDMKDIVTAILHFGQ